MVISSPRLHTDGGLLRKEGESGFEGRVVEKKGKAGQLVVHDFNPRIREAKADRSLSLRPAWTTERAPGQPILSKETLS